MNKCYFYNHIENSLEVYFWRIEGIISEVQDPIKVRHAIVERFVLLLPEELHEHIDDYVVIRGKKHSSREGSTSTSSTPTTPILNNEAENIIVRKKAKRFM